MLVWARTAGAHSKKPHRPNMKKSKSISAVIRRARAQGRAEAATIIASLCPETGLDQFFGCSPNGESGDYSSYWKEDVLRRVLCADAEVCAAIDNLQGADQFLHYVQRDLMRAQEELTLLKQNPDGLTNLEAARFRYVAQCMPSQLARRFGSDVSTELPEVLASLDLAMGYAGALRPTNG